MGITRFSSLAGKDGSVTVGTSAATTDPIIMSEASGGRLHVPSGSSITQITWYDILEDGDTYLPSNDEDAVSLVQAVSAGKSYAIPSALFAAFAVKPVGDAAGEIKVRVKG